MSSDTAQEATHHFEEASNKRKREVKDHGDREQKKVHVEDSRLSIEDLHVDVGEKYLLCRTPHPVVRPYPSEDLFELYSLTGIAGDVARTLPNGEKNGLRKTYKGHIKRLGVNGHFDVVKKKLDAPDSLFAMIMQPEVEWNMQYVQGKEIERGLPEAARACLGKAMTMARGPIPKNSWDSSVLGELAAPPASVAPAKSIQIGVKAPASHNAAVSRPTKTDIPRPKRNVKKRGYGESSFEGYGEGYGDDDLIDGGYSTGDGEDRAMGPKRRKKTPTTHGFQDTVRHSSYGPGMVGA
jgi:hypothetical protein